MPRGNLQGALYAGGRRTGKFPALAQARVKADSPTPASQRSPTLVALIHLCLATVGSDSQKDKLRSLKRSYACSGLTNSQGLAREKNNPTSKTFGLLALNPTIP